ncbi:MAG: hypothetical protein OXI33_03450 [Chloroflexota bacterium]|nr:hypothetical protein [Chloroflexota bacterium]
MSTITVWIEGGRTMTIGVMVGGAGLGVGVGTSRVGSVVSAAGVRVVGLSTTWTSGGVLSQQAAPKTPTAPQTTNGKNRRLSTGSPPFPGTVPSHPRWGSRRDTVHGATYRLVDILPLHGRVTGIRQFRPESPRLLCPTRRPTPEYGEWYQQ